MHSVNRPEVSKLIALDQGPIGNDEPRASPLKQHEANGCVLIKRTPAKLVGIVHFQPDADAAIKQEMEEYNVPLNERGRLIAQRRD